MQFQGDGRGGGVEDLNCTRLFFQTDKQGKYFPSRKVLYDTELIEHDLFSCFRVLAGFFPQNLIPPLFPQESNGPRLRKTDTFFQN